MQCSQKAVLKITWYTHTYVCVCVYIYIYTIYAETLLRHIYINICVWCMYTCIVNSYFRHFSLFLPPAPRVLPSVIYGHCGVHFKATVLLLWRLWICPGVSDQFLLSIIHPAVFASHSTACSFRHHVITVSYWTIEWIFNDVKTRLKEPNTV